MASEKEQAEQSALINLDSLEVKKSRPGTGPGMEESGLIDLSGFTGGGPTETRATAGVPSGGPIVAGFVAAPKQSNTTLWVVLGGIVLAILVVVTIFVTMILTQGQVQPPIANAPPAGTPPAAAQPASATPTAATPPAAAAKAADAGAEADASPTPDAGSAPVAANDPKADPPARTPSRRSTRRASPRPTPPPSPARQAPAEEDAPPPAAAAPPKPTPPKPPPPKPAEESTSEVDDLLGSLNGKKPAAPAGGSDPVAAPSDPMLPAALTKRQILTVVKRNAGGVRKCKAQPPGASGTVTVRMQIAPNGSVSSANIIGGPVKGTAQGNCVERTVKVFRFPQFSGDPMQINMPFAM